MTNWQTIEELKDIFIENYTKSKLGSELEKACSEEYELKRDYNGRQILELLQNVDDAYIQSDNDSKDTVMVKIVFKDNILEVGNTGTSFSPETIERLCLGRASDKSNKNIGNKGTGFRSLLNDAEWIELHSGDFSIRFSERYAMNQFNQYIDKSSEKFSSLIYTQYKNWKKDYPLCFPIMNCPEQISKHPSKFDTLIRVKIKEGNRKKDSSILNQLNQPFYKSLLFLPNITKIQIEIDDDLKEFEKVIDGKHVFLLESQDTLNEYYVEEKVVHRLVEKEDKEANIIIAIPLCNHYDFSNEKLYCYFPIRNFGTPVNALIHAPFLTNNSRDDIPNDNEQINKTIFEECLTFLKEIAEHLISDNTIASDLPIKTVTPTNDFMGKLWDEYSFNLKSFYLQLLANTKLLPTVNSDYISISNKPKYFNYDFPKQFKGDLFKSLLAHLPNNVYEFIKKLAYYSKYYNLQYTENELVERINQLSNFLGISDCVSIFLWLQFKGFKEIPQLLKDTAGNWIQKNTKVFLPTDSGISTLPDALSWVNLCILDQSYVDELINQLKLNYLSIWNEASSKLMAEKSSNKRILDKISDLYFSIQFTQQSNADLIIDEINKQVDTNKKAVLFINWFYANYKDKLQENTSRYQFDYHLPDRYGNLKSTYTLFFGRDYGNELSEKLFNKSKYSAVADFETLFKGLEDEKEDILVFLKKCGVSTYPKIYQSDSLATNSSFANFVKKKYNYEYNINYLSAKYIDDFEETLTVLQTKEIVHWITNYIDLYNLVLSNEKTGYFSNKKNTYQHAIYGNEYIRFILNKTKWIEINDKKYSPNDIVKYAKLKDRIDGIYGISERELIELLGKQVVQEMKLDFVDSLAAFPDNIIRHMLSKLPEFDKGEISRALYEDITKLKKNIMPTYSTSNLQVLATDGNYYDNKSVKYAARRSSKAGSESTHFIHIPTKRNTATIKNWLGVERYKMSLELVSFHNNTQIIDFEQEISDTKIVALSILEDLVDNNFKTTKYLKIIPCDYIKAKDIENNNVESDLDDYDYINHNGTYYIKIPTGASLVQIRASLDYRNTITEIFEEAVSQKIDQNQFAYLLSNNCNGKHEIICNQYGIDKWNTIYEQLFQKNRINELVIQFFKDNALDEQNLCKIKNIDFSNDLSLVDYNDLRDALTAIGKDIKDINHIDDQLKIDIRYCIKKDFSNYRDSNAGIYKSNCYLYAIDNKEAQKTFIEDWNKFRCFDLDINSIENSISINYDEILKKQFNKFDPESAHDIDCVNIDDKYHKNYELIMSEIKDRGLQLTSAELDFYLASNQEDKSMLYFGVPENILKNLEKFSNEESDGTTDVPSKDIYSINHNTEKTFTIKTTLLPINNDNSARISSSQIKPEKSQRQYEKEAANKEKAGKIAEQIAYAELKKTYPNLVWHSKNSDKPADKNNVPVNIVCDMWSIDDNNVKIYFEIKSSTNEFEMSINEYHSMESAPDNYEVVLVNNDTRQISRHKFNELKNLKRVSKYKFCFIQSINDLNN